MSDKSRFVDHTRQAEACRTLLAWRWWLPPVGLALLLILFVIDPFIGDWDAIDYTIGALRGEPSSMALGRSLFIFYNHGLFWIGHAAFGLAADRAYLIFKFAVVAQAVFAVAACWVLTRDLTESPQAATLAALLVACSPVFAIYGGQVMTDVPAQLLLTVALIVHYRGLKQSRAWLLIVGAALLGAGVNLRETVAFYVPWLIFGPFVCGWRMSRRTWSLILVSGLVFLVSAAVVFGFFFLSEPGYRAAWYGWRESMRAEAALHPISIRMLWPWLSFFVATSPVALLALPPAALGEWRRRRLSPLLLMAAVGLFANGLLLLNYSTAIGWRYFLTGLPTIVPLSASYLVRVLGKRLGSPGRALLAAGAAIVLISIAIGILLWPVRRRNVIVRLASKNYDSQLQQLPNDAVLISGAQTIAVKYWRALGKGDWDVVGPGAGWPGAQLPAVIDNYLVNGRRVFVDADPRWWQPCSWHVREIEELAGIQGSFHFRHVAETVYEVRPATDAWAADDPHLEKLLPANRPEEVKQCFGS